MSEVFAGVRQSSAGSLMPRLVAMVAALAALVMQGSGPVFADGPPKPATKDSPRVMKSHNLEMTAAVEPAEAKAGDTVTFKVKAKLDPGYHVYKYSTEKASGPSYTTFDFFDTAGAKVEGTWTPARAPIKHKDPNFADLPFVEYYEDEVTWSIPLRIPAGTEPGKKVLRCQAHYQVCNDKTCSFPGQWTIPDVELTVLAGKGAESTAAPAPKQATAAPAAADSSRGAQAVQSAAGEPKTTDPANGSLSQREPAAASAGAEKASATAPASDVAPAAKGGVAAPASEIAQKAAQGLLPFLLASALGGLFALVMPCVWPMVPITVNFFVKQGQGQGGRTKTTGLAIVYCLSIIGVFTVLGVFFSFFFSAASLQRLANNPWLNLCVAGLFIAFGLSLLGLFELQLPSFLLNASSHGERRGGIVGVGFMALTLVITSFTCTFPVVGGLLVMAAGGEFFYPIIGLATFAAVIALPFFLLALSPNLIARMPRSGDWMNAVKVVGGLIEIGAALKFINTAELAFVTPENTWFDAQVVLTCWVVLAAVCGLYLLGLFRTDHDHDEVKVGPGRLVMGSLFLALALFMAPALFGRVPQSVVWNRLIVGLLPPDSKELNAHVAIAGLSQDPALMEVKATSSDPDQAERQEKTVHGVQWGMSLDQALELAKAGNKAVLIDFTGENCANCRAMESGVFPLPSVVALLKKFVTVQLYTDFVPIGSITADQRQVLAERNQERIIKLANANTNPSYVVLSPDGDVLATTGGLVEAPVFVNFLSKALEKLSTADKVAQTTSPSQ
jgi:thiol:disulfide interchange protein